MAWEASKSWCRAVAIDDVENAEVKAPSFATPRYVTRISQMFRNSFHPLETSSVDIW